MTTHVGHITPVRRFASWGLLVVGAILAASCSQPPGPPAPPGPPTIKSLQFISARTRAPVVGVLRWSIADPNHDRLTCRVDIDGDGTTDRTIQGCSSGDSVLVEMPDPESRTVTLEVYDSDSAPASETVDITVGPAPAEDYGITLRLDPGMDPVFQAAFEDAAARWEQVITAGVPDVALNLPGGLMGWVPAFKGTVDDVLIDARATPIDGPGNVLGSAGGILIRPGHWQPYYGVMQFDTADLQMLDAKGWLYEVILHEMGHVLGLGTSWMFQGRIADPFTNPGYTGQAGIAAYRELGGSGRVPVENQGSLGTALGHWRESLFADELMTGHLGPADAKLSRLSIAALADQGYGVDMSVADTYSIPGTASRAAPDSQRPEESGTWLHAEPIPPMTGGPTG